MTVNIKTSHIITLLFIISIAICGCSSSQEVAMSKSDMDAKIAKILPPNAQLAASSLFFNPPLSFQASVDGVVYYIGNGDIFLNTPLKKDDIIKLNYYSESARIPNTIVSINEKMVYHNPNGRYGDNRFYFIPDTAHPAEAPE